jgi:flagellar hook-associated protein 1 FlgK
LLDRAEGAFERATVVVAADPQRTASIVFASANGDYGWELRDSTTNALLGSGSAIWQAGQPIALNGFELQLQGVPSAGDSFTVARTPYPAASNGNALALAALRDAALVGGHKVADAYASLMAGVGIKVQSARTAADLSAASASQVHAQLEAQTGVNLDEAGRRACARGRPRRAPPGAAETGRWRPRRSV